MNSSSRRLTSPVEPNVTTGVLPEFGRTGDVNRLYGIKRGTLYALNRQGKVKSCLLRVAGQKSGVRLWHLESIRQLVHGQMAAQLLEQASVEENRPGDRTPPQTATV
jgi:hypothetical protein